MSEPTRPSKGGEECARGSESMAPSLSDGMERLGTNSSSNLPIPVTPQKFAPKNTIKVPHKKVPVTNSSSSHHDPMDEIMDEGFARPSGGVFRDRSVSKSTPSNEWHSQLGNGLVSTLFYLPNAVTSGVEIIGSAVFTEVDEDKVTNDMGEIALLELSLFPQFANLYRMLRESIAMMDTCKLVSLRDSVLSRLYKVAIFISKPYVGLLSHALDTSMSPRELTATELKPLENIIARAVKYFKRFCNDDFVQFTLCGREPERRLRILDEQLTKACDGLKDAFLFNSGPPFPVLRPSFVVCDVKKSVENAIADPMAMDKLLSTSKGLGKNVLSYESEIKGTFDIINGLRDEAVYLTTYTPQKIIKQRAMRDFWLTRFSTKQLVTLDEFSDALFLHLTESWGLKVLSARSYADKFKSIVSSSKPFVNPLDLNNMLVPLDIARLTRCIPYSTDVEITLVLDIVLENLEKSNVRLLPPPPTTEVFWSNELKMEELLSAIANTLGWVSVFGPRLSGKTCSVLHACHAIPRDKDVLWVDFTKVASEMEAVSRTISQLFLRNCAGKPDFIIAFKSLLLGLKQGSIVVFDNMDGDGDVEESSTYESFAMTIIKLCEEFEQKLCFVVVGRELGNLTFAKKSILIGELGTQAALNMATLLLPADPESLIIASGGLAGWMACIVKSCSLGSIRSAAEAVTGVPAGSVVSRTIGIVAEGLAADLSSDERLCASCLFRGTSAFDEGMAWALCKDAFALDQVRWLLAWNGLLGYGWIRQVSDLGFLVPRDALVTGTISLQLSERVQWNHYVNYWADQVKLINTASEESLASLEHFDNFRPHYKYMLGCFFKKAPDGNTNFAVRDLVSLAALLSGHLGRILNNRFSPQGGALLAEAVVNAFVSASACETHSNEYLNATVDLAVQLRRCQKLGEAIKKLEEAMRFANVTAGKQEKARCHAVLGALYHASIKFKEAEAHYVRAIELWDSEGLTSDVCNDNMMTQYRKKMLIQSTHGCKCAIM